MQAQKTGHVVVKRERHHQQKYRYPAALKPFEPGD